MNCLDYFKQLCSVPHGSGNTKQVSDLLFSFCKEHGCECIQDKLGNVIAYKAGSTGRESEAPVILQGHMDMVCVGDEGVTADLTAEPIVLKDDGQYIRADGTSLGADDGIGAAMIMNVLADDTISHPPIEAVFTVDEETGMIGANGLDFSLLKGRRMINLDDEYEGSITVGCAGGTRLSLLIPCMWETLDCGNAGAGGADGNAGSNGASRSTSGNDVCCRVCVSGLKGGHSGCEITDHRANAGRLLARILYGLSLKMPVRLCSFKSGTADNVIPSAAEAIVAVPKENAADFVRLAGKHQILFKHEYPEETGLKIEIEKVKDKETENEIDKEIAIGKEIDKEVEGAGSRGAEPGASASTVSASGDSMTCEAVIAKHSKAMMRFLSSVPDGLRKMSGDFPDIAQTSSNAGIMTLSREGLEVELLLRSSVPEEMDELKDMVIKMAEHDGGRVTEGSSYPAWVYRRESQLRDVAISEYNKLTGMDPLIRATHGGLEVGIFDSRLEGLDTIAIGPTITDIHSPKEKMEIASAIRSYEWLVAILENI